MTATTQLGRQPERRVIQHRERSWSRHYRTVKGILAAGLEADPPPASTGDGGAAAFLHGPSRLFANVVAMPTASHLSLVATATGDGEPDPHDHEQSPAPRPDGDDHNKEATA